MPVNVRVVFHEPHVPKDNSGLANTGDMECHLLGVVLVLDDQVDDFGDMPGFIGSPIHIVDWDCSGESVGPYVLRSHILNVNE